MFFKETIYLGLYKDGERLGNAGFLKVDQRDEDGKLTLLVKNLPRSIEGKYSVRYYSGSDWKETDGITLRDGCGKWERREADSLERVRLQIRLPGGYLVEGAGRDAAEKNKPEPVIAAMPEHKQPESSVVVVPERRQPEPIAAAVPERRQPEPTAAVMSERRQPEPAAAAMPERKQPEPTAAAMAEPIAAVAPESSVAVKVERKQPEPRLLMADTLSVEGLKEDKWEQILDTYDNIHPYADERVYVKLEPKDFIILSGKYQHLVHNSFLLHGFYNYRHIALGKEGDTYVLGVPGVFYEREKMVALMFGFEAFECESGESKAGGFGYYLRQVEL